MGVFRRMCGEVVLNDLWRYHINSNKWTYLKPDYNRVAYFYYKAPAARYGHASVYIEGIEQDGNTNQLVLRKYMYTYGGFTYDCTNACFDLWKYDIPWAPMRYFPEPSQAGAYWNTANNWILVTNDSDTERSPGKRYRHSMITDYIGQNIYLYGGISFDANDMYFMNDMWKFYINIQKWEKVVGYGISSVQRSIRLWDGTSVTKYTLAIERKVGWYIYIYIYIYI